MNRADLRTVAAAVVLTVHAPPAMTFLHERHFQMPTAVRFTESWTDVSTLHSKREPHRAHLSAECAGVAGVLRDLHLCASSDALLRGTSTRPHLLDLLAERGTVTLR